MHRGREERRKVRQRRGEVRRKGAVRKRGAVRKKKVGGGEEEEGMRVRRR